MIFQNLRPIDLNNQLDIENSNKKNCLMCISLTLIGLIRHSAHPKWKSICQKDGLHMNQLDVVYGLSTMEKNCKGRTLNVNELDMSLDSPNMESKQETLSIS